jgi:hypothetical protein
MTLKQVLVTKLLIQHDLIQIIQPFAYLISKGLTR